MDVALRIQQIENEATAKHIESIFDAMLRNIFDALGGEDKIAPYDVANIKGSLTRAKLFALTPIGGINGKETVNRPGIPELPGSDIERYQAEHGRAG